MWFDSTHRDRAIKRLNGEPLELKCLSCNDSFKAGSNFSLHWEECGATRPPKPKKRKKGELPNWKVIGRVNKRHGVTLREEYREP